MRFLAILMFAVVGCASGPGVAGRVEAPLLPTEILVVAHRGAMSVRPENTMASFRRALEEGADVIELDVQLSRDGQVAVFHDDTLERTSTGEGRIEDHAMEDLSRFDAGSWFDPAYAGEPIPSLDEVLAWSAERVRLNVEIKEAATRSATLRLTVATVDLLRRHGLTRSTAISSFSEVACAEAVRLCPECEVAVLWDGEEGGDPVEMARRAGARAVHLALRVLTPEIAAAARREGWSVRVYTVNDRATLNQALDLGVSGIITDAPGRVLGWLGRTAGPAE